MTQNKHVFLVLVMNLHVRRNCPSTLCYSPRGISPPRCHSVLRRPRTSHDEGNRAPPQATAHELLKAWHSTCLSASVTRSKARHQQHFVRWAFRSCLDHVDLLRAVSFALAHSCTSTVFLLQDAAAGRGAAGRAALATRSAVCAVGLACALRARCVLLGSGRQPCRKFSALRRFLCRMGHGARDWRTRGRQLARVCLLVLPAAQPCSIELSVRAATELV